MYRVAFGDLTSDTLATERVGLELFGQANKEVKLRHLQVSKPSLPLAPFRLVKYSIGTTGSTGQVLASPVPQAGTNTTYGGNVRTYTSNPSSTAGTVVGDLQNIDISTSDVMNEHYGDPGQMQSFALQGSSESFGLILGSTGAVVFNGYLEFTVEPGPS